MANRDIIRNTYHTRWHSIGTYDMIQEDVSSRASFIIHSDTWISLAECRTFIEMKRFNWALEFILHMGRDYTLRKKNPFLEYINMLISSMGCNDPIYTHNLDQEFLA